MCAGSHTAPAETTSNDSSTMSQPQNRMKCPFSDFRDGTIFDSIPEAAAMRHPALTLTNDH
ncbi:hypothetical protein OUZ56_019204 [Daphnia magna]|uniref:Uncharacterized protein n=1 Tax=Daphnia magna TaxID=35525 RepID=A0ABQ9ZC10_9CRUS|nr:hypothetical protein OUZ56_019204 [Daphnia magna]